MSSISAYSLHRKRESSSAYPALPCLASQWYALRYVTDLNSHYKNTHARRNSCRSLGGSQRELRRERTSPTKISDLRASVVLFLLMLLAQSNGNIRSPSSLSVVLRLVLPFVYSTEDQVSEEENQRFFAKSLEIRRGETVRERERTCDCGTKPLLWVWFVWVFECFVCITLVVD